MVVSEVRQQIRISIFDPLWYACTNRSGKTSIRRVLFEKISPHETLIEPASVELEKWVFSRTF